jgi:hypothetical protein
MLVRFLKTLTPKPVKHYVAKHLPGSNVHKELELKTQMAAIKNQILGEITGGINDFVPQVKATTDLKVQEKSPNSQSTDAEKRATQLNSSNPIFKDFILQYQQLKKSGNIQALQNMQKDYPVCAAMGEQLSEYFDLCSDVKSPLANTMKRIAYTVVPFYNSSRATDLYTYKDTLPKIGLLSHPNPGPREFVLDALNGLAAAEDVDPETVIKHTWSQRHYDYLCSLRDEIKDKTAHLPADFFSRFPSKEWFIEQLTYRAESELGLSTLFEQKRWHALVVGDATSPLCLAALDTPRHKRPPLIYFAHGVSYGYPISTMFVKADYVFARGRRDEGFMIDLGFPKDNIIKVGSPSDEGFPNNEILSQRREHARLRCAVTNDEPVLVFAVTWDPYFYKSRSSNEIQELLVDSFALVAKKLPGKKPVLYLKYHPHPVNDPSFSTSRYQYPLDKFLELTKAGYSIRLAKTFDDCMPAADCFIGHESAVLCDAVANGLPTVSLDYAPPKGRPTLDYGSYVEPAAHKILSVYDNPDTISDAILTLMQKPRPEIWDKCRESWGHVFDCGRSEGLSRIGKFLKQIV